MWSGEKFAVQLTPEEREQLEHAVRAGRSPARVTQPGPASCSRPMRDGPRPGWPKLFNVAEGTVFRDQAAFRRGGVGRDDLKDRPQANRYRKLDDRGEAHLIALACSPAPEGHDHWKLRLLADRMVELGVVESLSYETVRLHLKRTSLKPWQKKQWCIPKVSRGVRGPHGGCPGSVCRTL